MKVLELLEAVKGNWRIQNLSGWTKTFKDNDSHEAREWMKNRDYEPPKLSPEERKHAAQKRKWEKEDEAEERRLEREQAQKEKRLAKKKTKSELLPLYRKWEDAIGNSFPDGDPRVSERWMEANGFKWEDVDDAFRAYTHSKSMNDYLADTWDEMANDAISDAEHGHIDQHSAFYHYTAGSSINKMVDKDDDSEAAKKVRDKLAKRSEKPHLEKRENPWR